MKKRWLSLFLAVSMLLSLFPVSSFAESDNTGGIDISAAYIPEEYLNHFALFSVPEDCLVQWMGRHLIYQNRYSSSSGVFGLLSPTGEKLTELIYDSKIEVGEHWLLKLSDGSSWQFFNSDTGELTDLPVDIDCTFSTYGYPEVAFIVAKTADTVCVLNAEGQLVMAPTMNITVKDYIGEGLLRLTNNNTGLQAVCSSESCTRTDFLYSRIGLNSTPYASNGRVYAERDGIAGFLSTETLEEIAFRYDTGASENGRIAQDFRGNMALINRSDGQGNTWHVLLDAKGKEIASLAEVEALLGDFVKFTNFSDNYGIAYLNGLSYCYLIHLTPEGYTYQKLTGLVPGRRISGSIYFGTLPDFSHGVTEVTDTTTGEFCLINPQGTILLRDYSSIEDIGTQDGVTWLELCNEEGLYGLYTVGGGFTGYRFTELYDLRGTVTREDGSSYEVALSPEGVSLFLDYEAEHAYAQWDDGYAYAMTGSDYYFCNLSDLTTHGPYSYHAYLGQNRMMIQDDPTTIIDFSGNYLYNGTAIYTGRFAEGYAPYCIQSAEDYHGLIGLDGTLYDFDWAFRPEILGDTTYGIFQDGTAIISSAQDSTYYLLRLQPGATVTPDPQLLYVSPPCGNAGLPVLDAITLTFDRPVTLPEDGQIQLLREYDFAEISISTAYGNQEQTVIRLTIHENLTPGQRYFVYVAEDAIWPQSGEEKLPFAGLTQPEDYSFLISEDGLTLSDLDLMRYFPTYLANNSTHTLESGMVDTYQAIMESFSDFDYFSMSYFHTLKDPANSLFGYIPSISQMRYQELLNQAIHKFLCAATTQGAMPKNVETIAAAMDGIDWRVSLSQDQAFFQALCEWMSTSDAKAFQRAIGKLEVFLDGLELTVETTELVCAIITTEILDRQFAIQLRDALPYQSQLGDGLNSMLNTLYNDTFLITKYCLDETFDAVCSYAETVTFTEIGHVSSGWLMLGKMSLNMLASLHDALGLVTAENLNELITYHGFVQILYAAVLDQQKEIVLSGADCTQAQADQYEMLYSTYLKALQLTLELSANMATNTQMADGGTLRQSALGYAGILSSGEYCYDVYMNSCKRNALNAASEEYLYEVARGQRAAALNGNTLVSTYAISAEESQSILYLPAEIDGYPVTTLGTGLLSGHPDTTILVIPDTVTTIEAGAFADCTTLEQVIFSHRLTNIGDGAFSGCTALTSINLPSSLASIGQNAFAETALTSVTMGSRDLTVGENAFPEGVVFFGREDTDAQALADAFSGSAVCTPTAVSQLEIVLEPDRLLYVPGERVDTTGLLLLADGEYVDEGWVTCCNRWEYGEQTVTVHYRDAKISYTVFVGYDDFYFENPYQLLVPDWLYGTLIAAAYTDDGQLTEVFLFTDACGTVYDLPWSDTPDVVRGFLLDENQQLQTWAAEY